MAGERQFATARNLSPLPFHIDACPVFLLGHMSRHPSEITETTMAAIQP
jgi:hypothetical protein